MKNRGEKTHELSVASSMSYIHLNHAHSYLNQEVSDLDGLCVFCLKFEYKNRISIFNMK